MLTAEQKTEYVKNQNKCPYCGSDDISAGHFEPEGTYTEVQCMDCLKIWRDCYTLTSIEEEDE